MVGWCGGVEVWWCGGVVVGWWGGGVLGGVGAGLVSWPLPTHLSLRYPDFVARSLSLQPVAVDGATWVNVMMEQLLLSRTVLLHGHPLGEGAGWDEGAGWGEGAGWVEGERSG